MMGVFSVSDFWVLAASFYNFKNKKENKGEGGALSIPGTSVSKGHYSF